MNNLSNCVRALKDVRHCMHNDTDPSITAALDKVIAEIESCSKQKVDSSKLAQVATEALRTLGSALNCFNAVAELVNRLSG